MNTISVLRRPRPANSSRRRPKQHETSLISASVVRPPSPPQPPPNLDDDGEDSNDSDVQFIGECPAQSYQIEAVQEMVILLNDSNSNSSSSSVLKDTNVDYTFNNVILKANKILETPVRIRNSNISNDGGNRNAKKKQIQNTKEGENSLQFKGNLNLLADSDSQKMKPQVLEAIKDISVSPSNNEPISSPPARFDDLKDVPTNKTSSKIRGKDGRFQKSLNKVCTKKRASTPIHESSDRISPRRKAQTSSNKGGHTATGYSLRSSKTQERSLLHGTDGKRKLISTNEIVIKVGRQRKKNLSKDTAIPVVTPSRQSPLLDIETAFGMTGTSKSDAIPISSGPIPQLDLASVIDNNAEPISADSLNSLNESIDESRIVVVHPQDKNSPESEDPELDQFVDLDLICDQSKVVVSSLKQNDHVYPQVISKEQYVETPILNSEQHKRLECSFPPLSSEGNNCAQNAGLPVTAQEPNLNNSIQDGNNFQASTSFAFPQHDDQQIKTFDAFNDSTLKEDIVTRSPMISNAQENQHVEEPHVQRFQELQAQEMIAEEARKLEAPYECPLAASAPNVQNEWQMPIAILPPDPEDNFRQSLWQNSVPPVAECFDVANDTNEKIFLNVDKSNATRLSQVQMFDENYRKLYVADDKWHSDWRLLPIDSYAFDPLGAFERNNLPAHFNGRFYPNSGGIQNQQGYYSPHVVLCQQIAPQQQFGGGPGGGGEQNMASFATPPANWIPFAGYQQTKQTLDLSGRLETPPISPQGGLSDSHPADEPASPLAKRKYTRKAPKVSRDVEASNSPVKSKVKRTKEQNRQYQLNFRNSMTEEQRKGYLKGTYRKTKKPPNNEAKPTTKKPRTSKKQPN